MDKKTKATVGKQKPKLPIEDQSKFKFFKIGVRNIEAEREVEEFIERMEQKYMSIVKIIE